ncbi:MAG: cation-translocating P-type ATPase [Anaerolineales bacterium]
MWHTKSPEQVAEDLDTSLTKGLSEEEAQRRLEQHGPNQLKERPRPGFLTRLWGQLNDFLILILIVAAILSGFLGWNEFRHTGEMTEFVDAIAIMTIVVLNAILGMVQEGKAEEALAALKEMASPEATVIRDGRQRDIPASEIVPGDLVMLNTGDYVPADVRLVQGVNLRIQEASLTGESVPVEKYVEDEVPEDAGLGDRHNCGYMSTTITYGRGQGIVYATGMDTEIGKIAEMIQSTEDDMTPLQLKLEQLGKWLGIASLAICAAVGGIGIVRDTELGILVTQGMGPYFSQSFDTIIEMFMVAVSLAIAAVPEGLPAVVTICLALGMQRMVERHALIRQLPAVETLGSASIICSDKTGTLTQNEMTVTHIYADDTLIHASGRGYEPHGSFHIDDEEIDPQNYPGLARMARAAALCNDAQIVSPEEGEDPWSLIGDPTEGALVVMAAKMGYQKDALEEEYPRVDEVPFDSKRKRMSTVNRLPDGSYDAYIKGAPDIMLDLCDRIYVKDQVEPLTPERREQILKMNSELASQALRVLAMAYRPLAEKPASANADDIEQNMIFLGLAGMIDPARPEVRDAIVRARNASIGTAMVTGDYEATAVAIAKELNLLDGDGDLERRVLSGRNLDRLSDEELEERAEDVVVYARVSPEHKVRIVDAHKKRGHVVAMTGDGVNDAPALKRASIGVAMGITGTDVSKETADMVLTDDNYASIVSAVEEGRIIFSNIRKFVYYLLSCNMAEIMILFLSMILNWPLPLTALQILVLNLVTDGAPALALGMEKGTPGIMDRPPRPLEEPIINGAMIGGTVVQTIAKTFGVLLAFRLGLSIFDELIHAQTLAYVTLSGQELLRAYTSRSIRVPIAKLGMFTNRWMQWAVFGSLGVLMLTVYVPGLNTEVFGTVPMLAKDWLILVPLMLLPPVADELRKYAILWWENRQA